MLKSLIIPVYRNAESLPDLLGELEQLSKSLDGDLEVVFVIDGSPDDSHAILAQHLPGASFQSQLLLHSRNFGSFAAIRSGLVAARGAYFAVRAADLQEPPEAIEAIFRCLSEGDIDIVVGKREERADPLLTRAASACFWGLYRRFIQPAVPKGGVDIFGCNKDFRDALLALEESNTSMIGLIYWLGFRRRELPYRRQLRRHGRSAWTVRRKLKYMMDSFFAFSDLPIRILLTLGTIGVLVAAAVALAVLLGRISGAITISGYAATMITILFFGALNLLALGIVGAYVWRGYANTQRRPEAVVMNRRVFDARPPSPR